MRKQPKQLRSKRAVVRLVDATAQAIADRGLAHMTTNHIAEAADVSVGTLYQYFDDKQDLVEALLMRISGELAEAVDATLADVMGQDVRTVVRGLITAALNAMEGQEGLYLELARNWHQLHSLSMLDALEEHMVEDCRRYILRHHDDVAIDNLPATLFVVINSTLFTIMRFLSQEDPPISREELIDTLSGMIAAYTGKSQ